MNRRLYFILPDVDTSRKVVNDLLLARIDEQHMHFLGKRGTDLLDLPEASSNEKTDIVHGVQVGIFSGALGGAILGIIIYVMQDFIGMKMQPGIVLLFFLLGGVCGIWIGGFLIGSSTPNIKIKEFEQSMNEGHILMMVDIPVERVDDVSKIVKLHHPEAEDHGVEPTIPAFP